MNKNRGNQIEGLKKINDLYHKLTNPFSKNISNRTSRIAILFFIGIVSFSLLSKSAIIGQTFNLSEEAYYKIYTLLICTSSLAIFSPFLIFNSFYRNIAFIVIVGAGFYYAGYSGKTIQKNPEVYMDYGDEISRVTRRKAI